MNISGCSPAALGSKGERGGRCLRKADLTACHHSDQTLPTRGGLAGASREWMVPGPPGQSEAGAEAKLGSSPHHGPSSAVSRSAFCLRLEHLPAKLRTASGPPGTFQSPLFPEASAGLTLDRGPAPAESLSDLNIEARALPRVSVSPR